MFNKCSSQMNMPFFNCMPSCNSNEQNNQEQTNEQQGVEPIIMSPVTMCCNQFMCHEQPVIIPIEKKMITHHVYQPRVYHTETTSYVDCYHPFCRR